jgi:hypothetical protein
VTPQLVSDAKPSDEAFAALTVPKIIIAVLTAAASLIVRINYFLT